MPSHHRLTVLVAFTLSGCSGLIYESVWSHYLSLYLGHAAYAQTLTLAIFMGGMTIGAWTASRYAHRVPNALMGYAAAEFVLGIAGFSFHHVYTRFIGLSYNTILPAIDTPSLVYLYKWSSGALLILPQSIVMGATFPLLCSALIRREKQAPGKNISLLYFTNSIGAAAGALIATFWLIPKIGMPGAVLSAGVMNILIAFGTYYISKWPEELYSPNDKSTGLPSPYAPAITRIALFASGLTGAVSFIYEMAWIRMLNLVLGTSLHAFEIMLSAFITGLAFGGLWIRNRIDRIKDLLHFTGFVQVCMGLAAISTLALYVESFDWVSLLLKKTLKNTDTGYGLYNLATSLISGLIMIPATFCAGMTLPLLTTWLIRHTKNENAIGKVYASNTIGAILGIAFAIHVGMLALGLKRLMIFAGLLDIALGLFLLIRSPSGLKISFSIKKTTVLVFLILLSIVSLFTPMDPSRLSSGTFRYGISDNKGILFYRDGKTASVSVRRTPGSPYVSIATNGKPDAALRASADDLKKSAVSDEPTMTLLGALPIIIKKNAGQIANIGFGSGLTTHVILSSPSVKTLDTIEIEPMMVEGARLFLPRTQRAHSDPRSTIHFEDAKTFFAATGKQYDVIISEPSNPWVAGVGNLFTTEFYHHIKRQLKEDGLLVQWIHFYEISLPTILTALQALDTEFPQYDLYASSVGDIIIVAAKSKSIDLSLRQEWKDLPEKLKDELRKIEITAMDQLNTRKFGNKRTISALLRASPMPGNSDYFPLLSLLAPRDRYMKASAGGILGLQRVGSTSVPHVAVPPPGDTFHPDPRHPFFSDYTAATQIGKSLISGVFETTQIELTGTLHILTNYREYCINKEHRSLLIRTLLKSVTKYNYFFSEQTREKLIQLIRDLPCTGQLSGNEKNALTTMKLALQGLPPESVPRFRSLIKPGTLKYNKSNYHEFLLSGYLTSLIRNPRQFTDEDRHIIEYYSEKLSLNNKWLQAILEDQMGRSGS